MMKIKILKQQLETALKICEKYTEKKDASSITSHFLFTANADENTLVISATDYDIGLIHTIRGVNVLVSGSVTASAKKALNIVSKLDNDKDVILEHIGDNCVITQDDFNFNLESFVIDDFFDFIERITDVKTINVDSDEFFKQLKLIEHAIDQNNPKASLNGAYVAIKSDKIELVGTDNLRLAISRIENVNNDVNDIKSIFVDSKKQRDDENIKDDAQVEAKVGFVIPKKAIALMQNLFTDRVQLSIINTSYCHNIHFLVVNSQNSTFFVRLIDDEFVEYEKVIPQEFCKTLNFSVKNFQKYLKKIAIMADKAFIGFKTDNKLIFGSQSILEETDGVSAVLDKNLEMPKDFVLSVRIKHITDFLNQVEENNFDLKLPEKEKCAFMLVSEKINLVLLNRVFNDKDLEQFRAKFNIQAPKKDDENDMQVA